MVTVVSRHLLAVEAEWDEGPRAGEWIADRLGPFGPSVGHAVPLGYPAYAIVPIQWDENDEEARAPASALDALLDVLEPFTGDQSVHAGIWPGFGWMYETGGDPRANSGVGVFWSPDEPPPTQQEIDRIRAEGIEAVAAGRVESPDAEPLALPHREYYLWTGPLRSALAFRHEAWSPPSLVWPDDRSWFVGAPIYTNEIAVAAAADVIDAVLADSRLVARTAAIDEILDIDD
jgi:hypothetical protein